jgi:hypothetical protein
LNELILIKLLLNKNSFKEFFNLINLESIKENHREIFYLYKSVKELREQFPDKDFTVDELRSFFYAQYPESKADIYDGLFKTLSEALIDPEVGQGILGQIKRRQGLLKASERAYAASQGTAEISEVLEILQGIEESKAVGDETPFVTTDLEELVNGVVKTRGISFPLNCLAKSLGSLRKGDFGFIFARPETGKTTFLSHIAGHALTQDIIGPVLWLNNEEAGNKVMLRVYQSYFGVKLNALLANVRKYKEEFQARVGGKFLLVDSAQIDRSTVEAVCEKHKPSLIIYDQIDKIRGFKADRDDLVYGAIYQWGRELAKQYAPSIGVCQADGTAEGQKWLTMANVSNAKTSKQAEADWILGIGKTHDEASEYIRYFNISKNKLVGDEDSIPSLRHGRFEVVIDPEVGRYRDIVIYE